MSINSARILLLLLIHAQLRIAVSIGNIVPVAPSCGYWKYFNGNVCTSCPRNSIISKSGYGCIPCPPDKPIARGFFCDSCQPGQFLFIEKSSRKICRYCPSNSYFSTTLNAKSCTRCPRNGTYHPGHYPFSGSYPDRCVICDKGYFHDIGFRNNWSCFQCSIGSIPRYYGRCSYCPDGFAYRKDGRTDCQPCPAGTYARRPVRTPSIEPVGCLICPVGTYTSQVASTTCLKCPPGTYSTPSRTECIADCKRRPWTCRRVCGAGKEWDYRAGKCKSCIGNSVSKWSSVTPCVKCFTGQRADRTKQTCKCSLGLALHFAGEGKGWKCTKCPKPLFSVDNDRCQCANGFLTSLPDRSSCRRTGCILDSCKCKAGYTIEEGCCCTSDWKPQCLRKSPTPLLLCGRRGYVDPFSGFCEECPLGFKPAEGGLSCKRCSAGDIGAVCGCGRRGLWKVDGSSRCETCPPGFKAAKDGLSCVRCTKEDVCETGQKDCDCGTGKVFDVSKNGTWGCMKCPKGTAGGGTKLCNACNRYHYAPHRGMGECMKCPKNQRYGWAYGLKACPPPCIGRRHVVGTYWDRKCVCKYSTDVERDGTCTPCKGLLSPTKNRKSCKCLRGGVGIRDGKCRLCKPGTYREPSDYNMPCAKCWENTIAPRWGASTCIECRKGKVSLFEGGTKCMWCPAGKFLTVAGTCGRCAAGFYVFRGRCVACPWGSMSMGGTSSYCLRCGLESVPNKEKNQCVKKV